MSRKLVSWGGVLALFAAALIGAECRSSGSEPESSAKPVEPQVMLHVQIIEADRALLAETFERLSSDSASNGSLIARASGLAEQSCVCTQHGATKVIDELRKRKGVRVVASPTLVVLSGHEASLLLGVEFPVPTVAGVGDSAKTSTSVRHLELSMFAKPRVLAAERLELELSFESTQLGATTTADGVSDLRSKKITTTFRCQPGQNTIVLTMSASPAAVKSATGKKDAKDVRGLMCLVTPELVKPLLDEKSPIAPATTQSVPSAATPTISEPHSAPSYSFARTSPFYQPMPLTADSQAQMRDLVLRHASPYQLQPRQPAVPANGYSPAFVPELFDHIGGWHPLSEVLPPSSQPQPSSPAGRPLTPIPGHAEHAGAWDSPRPLPERTRGEELRAALMHLEAAGLKENAEQVRREIKLEERAIARRELDRKERELETLKKQIELLRQSVNELGSE